MMRLGDGDAHPEVLFDDEDAPTAANQLWHMDPERTNPWIARLFGSHTLALGFSLLTASDEDSRDLLLLGVVIDSVDVVSTAAELRRGEISQQTAVGGAAGAVLFTVLGLLGLREIRASRRALAR